MFEKQAKKLIKKYPSLKNELLELVRELKSNPSQGIPLGKNCFKIRIAISSKGKEKVVEEELLPILLLQIIQFFCSPFMINLNKKTLQKRN